MLGAQGERYLVPPGIDVLELGLIGNAGQFELLPIDVEDKPLWDEVIHLLLTEAQARQQRNILMRSYQALYDRIAEAKALEADIDDWSGRGATHPIFGIIRLETIATWKALRRGTAPLGEDERDRLHERVARRVAGRIQARLIR